MKMGRAGESSEKSLDAKKMLEVFGFEENTKKKSNGAVGVRRGT